MPPRRPTRYLILFIQRLKGIVLALGERLAVIARNLGDQLALAGRETKQFRMADEMIGMFMVTAVGDKIADIVQQGGGLQQLAVRFFQVEGDGQRVKDGQGQLEPHAANAAHQHGRI